MTTRRQFLKNTGMITLGATGVACNRANNASEAESAAVAEPAVTANVHSGDSANLLLERPEHPAASTADRLPLEWHQNQVVKLQQKLRDRGLDGILISDRWNIIYFTGLWHTTTERPFSCFIPTDDLAVHWFWSAAGGSPMPTTITTIRRPSTVTRTRAECRSANLWISSSGNSTALPGADTATRRSA
jgi:hypothetical protein